MIEDVSYKFSSQDIEDNKLMAVLCYVGIFVLVPIWIARESPYVRFNINQGLIICIASTAMSVFGVYLRFVPLGSLFAWAVNFAVLSVAITAIYHIFMGRAVKFPYIGDIELIK